MTHEAHQRTDYESALTGPALLLWQSPTIEGAMFRFVLACEDQWQVTAEELQSHALLADQEFNTVWHEFAQQYSPASHATPPEETWKEQSRSFFDFFKRRNYTKQRLDAVENTLGLNYPTLVEGLTNLFYATGGTEIPQYIRDHFLNVEQVIESGKLEPEDRKKVFLGQAIMLLQTVMGQTQFQSVLDQKVIIIDEPHALTAEYETESAQNALGGEEPIDEQLQPFMSWAEVVGQQNAKKANFMIAINSALSAVKKHFGEYFTGTPLENIAILYTLEPSDLRTIFPAQWRKSGNDQTLSRVLSLMLRSFTRTWSNTYLPPENFLDLAHKIQDDDPIISGQTTADLLNTIALTLPEAQGPTLNEQMYQYEKQVPEAQGATLATPETDEGMVEYIVQAIEGFFEKARPNGFHGNIPFTITGDAALSNNDARLKQSFVHNPKVQHQLNKPYDLTVIRKMPHYTDRAVMKLLLLHDVIERKLYPERKLSAYVSRFDGVYDEAVIEFRTRFPQYASSSD